MSTTDQLQIAIQRDIQSLPKEALKHLKQFVEFLQQRETADKQACSGSMVIESKLLYETGKTQDEEWLLGAAQNLSQAYGSDEPVYEVSMLKEVNPDYDPR